MCGRFVSASPPDEIARYFGAAETDEVLIDPSYNVAPTDDVYAVLEHDGARHLDLFRWGLVPSWAKSPSVGSRMINARAETLAGRFQPSFRRRRCIVPADGFYEWQAFEGQKRKQPLYIHRADGAPLAMAGLWESWRDPDAPDAPRLHTCTIITTAANGLITPVHDRMPVILPADAWDLWLDPTVDDLDELGGLLLPAPESLLELRPVSSDVNSVKNNGVALIAAVEPDPVPIQVQGTLL